MLGGVAPEDPAHRRALRVRQDARGAGHGGLLVEVGKLPRQTRKPKKLWLWWSEEQKASLDLIWKAYCRWFDLEHTIRFMKQTLGWMAPRVRHPEQADRWTWLILVAYVQLRLARHRCRPEAAVGATATASTADPDACLAGFRHTPGGRGHPGEAPKTLREIPRPPEGQPHGAGQAPSGAQNGRLSEPRRPRTQLHDRIRHPRTIAPALKTSLGAPASRLRRTR